MIKTFDPAGYLTTQHPSWHVGVADLGGRASELISLEAHAVIIDPAAWGGDLDRALAHVGAHLDYHPHLEELTDVHEDHADLIADLRLDRPGSRM